MMQQVTPDPQETALVVEKIGNYFADLIRDIEGGIDTASAVTAFIYLGHGFAKEFLKMETMDFLRYVDHVTRSLEDDPE